MTSKASNNKVSFTYSFKVTEEHLDTLNHVNNIVYLQWVQDISEKHWNSLATDQIRSANVWMALRHEIDYLNQAFLGDNISILTWIEDSAGVKSIRIVHIYKEDILLTKCKTTWVLLDSHTLKPKRIDKTILDLFAGPN